MSPVIAITLKALNKTVSFPKLELILDDALGACYLKTTLFGHEAPAVCPILPNPVDSCSKKIGAL